MDTRKTISLRLFVLVVDGVMIVVAMFLAYIVQDLLRGVIPQLKRPPRYEDYAFIAYLALPLWLLLLRFFRLDRVLERQDDLLSLLGTLIKVDAFGVALLSLAVFATKTTELNRSLVALFVVILSLLLLLLRIVLRWWTSYQYATGVAQTRLLLVGRPGAVAKRLLQVDRRQRPPVMVGYLAIEADHDSALPHLGTPIQLAEVLHEHAVDRVVVLPPLDQLGALAKLASACDELGIPLSLAVDHDRHQLPSPQLEHLHGVPLVSFAENQPPALSLALKQLIDLLLAALLLLLATPLLLFAALGVALTMGCPIFFSQRRAGLRGRTFQMIKFRTMRRDAEALKSALAHLNETEGPTFKSGNDPRTTPFGRFLRRMSLDELPQLLHVLSGKMSLVGPRPLPAEEQEQIRGWHRRRLSMKPGITGLWQVSGRSEIGFEEWMQLDLQYVDNWSLATDLLILIKTIPAVLRGKGAH